VLANIPPQPVPETFQPDNRPSPKVHPTMAVLQPSSTHLFSAADFTSNVAWSVSGEVGGSSDLGTITAEGLYKAPAEIPSRLPVSVSASSQDGTAAATVDILRKEELVAGLGFVQAVAYLESAEHVYTAETKAAAVLGVRSGEETRVYSVLPGPRREVNVFSNETITKMLPFGASNGKEYLLLVGRSSRRIIRLDPVSGQWQEVITGLVSPTAITFDTETSDLLVADGDVIRSYPRHVLETGLFARTSPPSPISRQAFIGGFGALLSLTVDACTGDFFVTDEEGNVIQVDRLSGEKTTLLAGEPVTQLLPLYRSDVPCPAAFHLLATAPEKETVFLLVPHMDHVAVWYTGSRVSDLAFLPSANPLVVDPAVLLGEAEIALPDPGLLSAVPVEDLYAGQETVPGSERPPAILDDPTRDTLGYGPIQYDITRVTPSIEGESLLVTIELLDPFTPATYDVYELQLVALIELDVDQNPETGVPSLIDSDTQYWSGLGVDYAVETEVNPETGMVAFVRVTGYLEGEFVAEVPISFEAKSLTVRIPVNLLEGDPYVNLDVIVGYYYLDEAVLTDVAPNLGYISSGPPN
jgi:hypothetical protein